eukprot:15367020-Ditylum_brightwellii.AAC.2
MSSFFIFKDDEEGQPPYQSNMEAGMRAIFVYLFSTDKRLYREVTVSLNTEDDNNLEPSSRLLLRDDSDNDGDKDNEQQITRVDNDADI